MMTDIDDIPYSSAEPAMHALYLRDFRVAQCPLFLQQKCSQHRPFTCFDWHFPNQRRRRPEKRMDGSFNYNPEVYCARYDEATGICPNGDSCPFVHRTAGDTERRYHLMYYKTVMCMYDMEHDLCTKNGLHCCYAHGLDDFREPILDTRKMLDWEKYLNPDLDMFNSERNKLDEECGTGTEDSRWQSIAFVFMFYKTEVCQVPPRLCKQGYACPLYHNTRDKRRSPQLFKYKSTPCPSVKVDDEWGPPTNCNSGDDCPFCHTRTEQQFHPDIYKSTKCKDVCHFGYCPRSVFCAFAHSEEEMSAVKKLYNGPSLRRTG